MLLYPIEQRTKEYVKEYRFLSFARKYKKQLLDTGLDSLKTDSKKVVHNAGEFLGSKTTEVVTNLNDDKIVKPDKKSKKYLRNNYSIRKKR